MSARALKVERTPETLKIDVGTCAGCTDALYLVRDENGVRVECICGASDIPAEFFEASYRIGLYRRILGEPHEPGCTCVSLEEVSPSCTIHSTT